MDNFNPAEWKKLSGKQGLQTATKKYLNKLIAAFPTSSAKDKLTLACKIKWLAEIHEQELIHHHRAAERQVCEELKSWLDNDINHYLSNSNWQIATADEPSELARAYLNMAADQQFCKLIAHNKLSSLKAIADTYQLHVKHYTHYTFSQQFPWLTTPNPALRTRFELDLNPYSNRAWQPGLSPQQEDLNTIEQQLMVSFENFATVQDTILQMTEWHIKNAVFIFKFYEVFNFPREIKLSLHACFYKLNQEIALLGQEPTFSKSAWHACFLRQHQAFGDFDEKIKECSEEFDAVKAGFKYLLFVSEYLASYDELPNSELPTAKTRWTKLVNALDGLKILGALALPAELAHELNAEIKFIENEISKIEYDRDYIMSDYEGVFIASYRKLEDFYQKSLAHHRQIDENIRKQFSHMLSLSKNLSEYRTMLEHQEQKNEIQNDIIKVLTHEKYHQALGKLKALQSLVAESELLEVIDDYTQAVLFKYEDINSVFSKNTKTHYESLYNVLKNFYDNQIFDNDQISPVVRQEFAAVLKASQAIANETIVATLASMPNLIQSLANNHRGHYFLSQFKQDNSLLTQQYCLYDNEKLWRAVSRDKGFRSRAKRYLDKLISDFQSASAANKPLLVYKILMLASIHYQQLRELPKKRQRLYDLAATYELIKQLKAHYPHVTITEDLPEVLADKKFSQLIAKCQLYKIAVQAVDEKVFDKHNYLCDERSWLQDTQTVKAIEPKLKNHLDHLVHVFQTANPEQKLLLAYKLTNLAEAYQQLLSQLTPKPCNNLLIAVVALKGAAQRFLSRAFESLNTPQDDYLQWLSHQAAQEDEVFKSYCLITVRQSPRRQSHSSPSLVAASAATVATPIWPPVRRNSAHSLSPICNRYGFTANMAHPETQVNISPLELTRANPQAQGYACQRTLNRF